ncbi:HNH/ENDO VII family nuclease [Bombella favorum]|uniref:LHH domain-containing protein n=1 Tax=Bombella favorum TaxID=2039164 RepID=A0ABR5ZNH9_9PROT|nr:HNH/ENDO VII family nuclease [Bombella favorum]MBA5725855.1 hypothetical protein [Bombella favorum]
MMNNNQSSIRETQETQETQETHVSDGSWGRYGGMAAGAILGTMVGGPEGGIMGGMLGGSVVGTALRVLDGESIPDAFKAEIEAVKHEIKVTAQEAGAIVQALGLDKTMIGSIIISLSGIGEASVYAEEGLKGAKVGDAIALVRPDIDMQQVDPVRNWTNAERMERGLPPLTPTGEVVELHQIGQKSDAPYAEVTNSIMSNVNTAVNLFRQETGVVSDIRDFGRNTHEYWQDRTKSL